LLPQTSQGREKEKKTPPKKSTDSKHRWGVQRHLERRKVLARTEPLKSLKTFAEKRRSCRNGMN